MEPNDRLQTVGIDSVDLANHSHFYVLLFFFRDSHVRRRVVYFVTHENVRHQGAFAGQERYCKLNSLSMPVLAIFALKFDSSNCFIELVQKSELLNRVLEKHRLN